MPKPWHKPAKYWPDNPYGSRYVPGFGPVPCPVMLIGEGPGETENRTGRPFTGLGGQILHDMLWRAGLHEVYITNVVKYHVPGDARPTAVDIRRDSHELADELRRVCPRWLGLVGATAVHQFLPKIAMEWAHGLAMPYGDGGVMALYHPAYGLHAPEAMPQVEYDFQQFGLMCKKRLAPRAIEDEYPETAYIELTDKDCDWPGDPLEFNPDEFVSIDTEGWFYNPWGLSFCTRPGVAYVIHKKARRALHRFAEMLHRRRCRIVLHNSLHDIEVLRALGIDIRGLDFVDTMVRAYLTCVEPQGLKPLALRHCGAEQDEYEDITRDAQQRLYIEYLTKAHEVAEKWLSKTSNNGSGDSSRTSHPKRKAKSMSRPAGKR